MPEPAPPPRSWSESERPVPRHIIRPLREFLDTETAGGLVLLAATAIALVWANSPLAPSYESLWETRLRVALGGFELEKDLQHWVNDGLMVLFFFVVGLEIKRELVAGELATARKAALPAIAALGGMVLPALVYLALNHEGEATRGWGIPMATDIAFALGVVGLLGPRVPSNLKVFLLGIAIADDIGAILVIAVFYSEHIDVAALALAVALLFVVVILRKLQVWWVPVYVVVGAGLWLATLLSGVHATIAGVALGLLAPARPLKPRGAERAAARIGDEGEEAGPAEIRGAALQARDTVSVVERLEHILHPWTSYVVIPIFALANAGVSLSVSALADAATSPVGLGVGLGLVVGKLVGITSFTWAAQRLRLGALPDGARWPQIAGIAAAAGIGFTVSLFITGLAFTDPPLVEAAKVGVLSASLGASLLSWAILRTTTQTPGREG